MKMTLQPKIRCSSIPHLVQFELDRYSYGHLKDFEVMKRAAIHEMHINKGRIKLLACLRILVGLGLVCRPFCLIGARPLRKLSYSF